MRARIQFYLLTILLGLSACSEQREIGHQLPLQGEVLATVNGVAIKEPELVILAQARQAQGQQTDKQAGIEELINIELLRQAAIAQGLHHDEKIAAEMNRKSIQVLASAVMQKYIDEQIVSEQELISEYNQYTEGLGKQEYRLRHILTKTEDQASANIADLNSGAAFIELAKKRSIDPAGERGGDLGWVNPGKYPENLKSAIEGLAVGTYSAVPVQSSSGWHVFKLEETRPSTAPAFDELRKQLRSVIINRRIKNYLEELRGKAKINTPGLAAAAADQAEG